MRKGNLLIMFAIWIGFGIWLALDGYIKIVIFLITAVILGVGLQFGIGWILFRISRFRAKLKNRKPN
jgi:predicted transcriptional regulator